MDLIDRVNDLASRIAKQQEHINTEEATKNAFIMPFLNILGYDVFNPLEVIPEYTADIGTKKGEKVDYAIKKDDGIIMLIECKWSGADLHRNHASQLYRYFSATESRFAILTNGLIYEFYSDIDEPNKMDSKPFFIFDILNFEEHQIDELKKFTKSSFSLDNILTTASTLKYAGAIKKIFTKELEQPSEAFVRFFASQIYDGRITQPVIEQFTDIVKDAHTQFINERLNDRLKSALSPSSTPTASDAAIATTEELPEGERKEGIVTTQDEIDGYNIVKAILRDKVDVSRITMRDTKSYCGILLDDNNRKPLCRLRFNHSQKYLGVMSGKDETKITIENVDEIFNHADALMASLAEHEG